MGGICTKVEGVRINSVWKRASFTSGTRSNKVSPSPLGSWASSSSSSTESLDALLKELQDVKPIDGVGTNACPVTHSSAAVMRSPSNGTRAPIGKMIVTRHGPAADSLTPVRLPSVCRSMSDAARARPSSGRPYPPSTYDLTDQEVMAVRASVESTELRRDMATVDSESLRRQAMINKHNVLKCGGWKAATAYSDITARPKASHGRQKFAKSEYMVLPSHMTSTKPKVVKPGTASRLSAQHYIDRFGRETVMNALPKPAVIVPVWMQGGPTEVEEERPNASHGSRKEYGKDTKYGADYGI